MKKCRKGCPACPYIEKGKKCQNKQQERKNQQTIWLSLIQCGLCSNLQKEKCKKAYLGKTKIMLKFPLTDHCGYVRNQTLDKAIGEYFSNPGHILSDLSITKQTNKAKEMIFYIEKKEKNTT